MSPPKDSRPDNYEMNAKICRLVEQCPFMYDRSHPQYLRKEICDEAWMRIAKEMGESVFPCRERWRNIRTSFARSINTNKVPFSANRTKPYYLHEELKFLARHITPGVPVRNKRRATSGSGEESEHIEVSVGEETFNGFERLSESTDTMQNGHETSHWQRHRHSQQNNDTESAGDGGETIVNIENDSCNSSYNGSKTNKREDGQSCSRFTRLPPPPLQAAPHSTLQHGSDETEAAAALQQIHMSSRDTSFCPPLSKRPREDCPTLTAEDVVGVEMGTDAQRQPTFMDTDFLHEMQTELINMNHRQRIHLKRRFYEALSEIYPLKSRVQTVESKSLNTTDATLSNQLALAALMRVENLCQNFKCNATSNNTPSNVTVPDITVLTNGTSSGDIDSLPPQVKESPLSTLPLAPAKRNGIGLRTRSRPTERVKSNTTANGTSSVKDEPEVTD